MRSRRLILCLILLTVAVFCLVAARKLAATPKYDRVRIGMSMEETVQILGGQRLEMRDSEVHVAEWTNDEGIITVTLEHVTFRPAYTPWPTKDTVVADKNITRRGPLERLAWLAGCDPSRVATDSLHFPVEHMSIPTPGTEICSDAGTSW